MASQLNYITAADERQRCMVLGDDGERCPEKSAHLVQGDTWDHYVCVCDKHLEASKWPGCAVEVL